MLPIWLAIVRYKTLSLSEYLFISAILWSLAHD
jgi:hypothetical protein